MAVTLSERQEEGSERSQRISESQVTKGFMSLVNEFGVILMLLGDNKRGCK